MRASVPGSRRRFGRAIEGAAEPAQAGRQRRRRRDDGGENGKADASGAPLLMLDTGGHMAKIQDITFTPDGRQLVSASDNKTIRVWNGATDAFNRILASHG
jgi:WD40 repeat protein